MFVVWVLACGPLTCFSSLCQLGFELSREKGACGNRGDKRAVTQEESALLDDKQVGHGSCGEGEDNDKLQWKVTWIMKMSLPEVSGSLREKSVTGKKWWNCLQSVQFSCSVVSDSATPWIAACQASVSITNSRSSLKLMSIESGDAIQPSHPLSSPSPPAPNPSQHQSLFQWVNSPHTVAKVLEFQL